jgi:type IV pilus assembly protein PilV
MMRAPLLRGQRGFGLFDGVVSLALLAFGMLALTRFETQLGSVANESAQRTQAAALADELLSAMLTDNANVACYTLPAVASPVCGDPIARAATDAWKARVMARLPHATAPTAVVDTVTGRFTVSLSWRHKVVAGDPPRTHQVISDIRAP